MLIICTWFRPSRLARYSAASAAASSSLSSRVDPASSAATPTDTVTCTDWPSEVCSDSPEMWSRTRSAMRNASTARVCGSSRTNSSPPNRPGRVVLPQHPRQAVRDLPEHLVAEQVPVGVVDPLEEIDVKHGDGERHPGPHGAGHLGLGLPLPGAGVQQSGLGVGPGVVQQLGVAERALQQARTGSATGARKMLPDTP